MTIRRIIVWTIGAVGLAGIVLAGKAVKDKLARTKLRESAGNLGWPVDDPQFDGSLGELQMITYLDTSDVKGSVRLSFDTAGALRVAGCEINGHAYVRPQLPMAAAEPGIRRDRFIEAMRKLSANRQRLASLARDAGWPVDENAYQVAVSPGGRASIEVRTEPGLVVLTLSGDGEQFTLSAASGVPYGLQTDSPTYSSFVAGKTPDKRD